MLPDNPMDLNKVRLSLLTYESQSLLSLLLNSKKALPSDGPDKLPRDWRGLATLLNITSEIAASINESPDKTAKVLEIWIKRNDDTATIGQLLLYLQQIDRHDVYDDLMQLATDGLLFGAAAPATALAAPVGSAPALTAAGAGTGAGAETPPELLTFDDVRCGSPQVYDGLVIFADEDRAFVEDMLDRMRARGYKLCTVESLLPGLWSQFAGVARLLAARCHRVVLVYSPDFLRSAANAFYCDYAQAVDIESAALRIMPVMYRACTLPPQHAHYYKLYYSPPGTKSSYDFWDKLAQSLEYTRALHRQARGPGLTISELPACPAPRPLPALPDVPPSSTLSLCSAASSSPLLADSAALSASGKKKTNPVKKFFNSTLLSFKGKKVKEALALQN